MIIMIMMMMMMIMMIMMIMMMMMMTMMMMMMIIIFIQGTHSPMRFSVALQVIIYKKNKITTESLSKTKKFKT